MTDTSESDDDEVLEQQALDECNISNLQGVWRHSNGAVVTVRETAVSFHTGETFTLKPSGDSVEMEGWQPVLARSTANRISWSKAGEDMRLVWSFEKDVKDDAEEEEVDKTNIITGKRKRATVDYKQLYDQQQLKRVKKKQMRARGQVVSDDDALDAIADEDEDEDEDEKKSKKTKSDKDKENGKAEKKPEGQREGKAKVNGNGKLKEGSSTRIKGFRTGLEALLGSVGEEKPDKAWGEAAAVLSILAQFKEVKMSLSTLKDTKVGLTVNKLRKHPDAEVKAKAKSLIGEWKTLLPA